ncbi:DNA-directed RNA polymerase III subunit RPC7-like protein [Trachymyrmex septentrionalis]|uniref:DNA-directed RNA polymerase III subunit RPC7-like protein n=1 Tax=Trachymyrmex septentrionalis TaxID=34720 RepID=A0A195ERS3_9HYME|nr:PREDICTED: DNA-directed RNA polymerase III subunit RPC7-like [Trachymyrmex septentrionalis]KYN30955.1 DNA-directed RNA polymerase III subunit RPC7-like protein [Trachymyrmex septentrionalis]
MTGRRGRWHGSRGRSAMPFSIEQFISKGETLPTPVSQPSSSYPPLERKPPPIQITSEMEYLVGLKRHFTEYMRESPYYVKAPVVNEDIERYSDAFKEDFTDNDESKYEKYHDWSLMPEELKAVRKRKPRQHTGNRKKKDMDIMKKLSELEKKENMQEEEDKEEGNEEENGEEKEDGAREEEQDEMDIGTDYTIEHTDNGEIETDDETDDVSFVT